MAKSTHDDVLDGALNIIKNNCTQEGVCTSQPTTYYEGCDPAQWAASTSYSLGDAVRPTTRDTRCYECTTAGTSGGTEPSWDTTPGNTTNDNTAVWTCRVNYNLAAETMTSGDFTVGDGDTNGRKVAVAQQADISIHTSGTALHVALLDPTNARLLLVTTCTSQGLTQGNTVTVPTFDDEIADPT